MCGIAGLWAARSDHLGAVEAMVASLTHRGPDASGVWTDPDHGIGLGHRRLAVVGLGPSGAQPMVSASGRWVLTYNGEIYGAPAIGRRLEAAGARFRGTSDTEVLVEALDAWGPEDALRAIDGMFAFGAWDREQHRLVLARDRIGEKPLAYGQIGGSVAFASEVGALRTVPGFDAGVDPEALALYLRFKYVPAPWTIHAGAKKLLPGHWLEITDPAGPLGEPRPYWSLDEEIEAGLANPVGDLGEAVDLLDEALSAAVRRQLRSDVPVGAFLSGGIDSSLVATVASEHLDRPLQTFTIGSPDPDFDESAAAREIATRIGADHTGVEVAPSDALALVPELAAIWDEPFGDSSQLPTLLVSRIARQAVTVALSGDGGDELFGGYNRHLWLPKTWARVGNVPGPARRALGWALNAPSPTAWDRMARAIPEGRRPRMLGLKAQKLAGVMEGADAAAAYGSLVSHWGSAEQLSGHAVPPTLVDRPDRWPGVPLAEQIMAVDTQTFLPDDVLVKVDRATMSIGLESRIPLLDRAVVSLAWRLPEEARIHAGTGKWALRQLLARRHPAELFDTPKAGFGIPIATWLRGPLRPWAEDLLSAGSLAAGPLADPTPVRSAWAQHLSGRADRSYEIWDVLMLQSWWTSVRSGQPERSVA